MARRSGTFVDSWPALLAAALVGLGACTPSTTWPVATSTARPAVAVTIGPYGTKAALPDGGFLVYCTDQGTNQPVWALQGRDEPRLISHANGFELAPDGRSVALVRGFPEELWVAAIDGSGERLLYIAPTGIPLIHRLLWAPDGKSLVFSLNAPGSPASQDPGALWLLDVPTGSVRKLADEAAHYPLFSPDSKWLSLASPYATYASHGTVGLIDLEGHGQPALFDQVGVRDRVWADDSSGFVAAFERHTADRWVMELWWIATSGAPVLLGQLGDVTELSWQPGGRRLAFGKPVQGGVTRLYLADRDGGDSRPIPGAEGMHVAADILPPWSPDGAWLLTMGEAPGFYLVDTRSLEVYPLDVHRAYGWTSSGHYLVGVVPAEDLERYRGGDDVPVDVYRCAPLGACDWLARLSSWAWFEYADK